MSTTRIWLAVGALIVAMISGLTSTIYTSRIADEVNRHRSKEERESPYWWHAGKTLRILEEYRRVCPEGRLRNRMQVVRAWGQIPSCAIKSTRGVAKGCNDRERRTGQDRTRASTNVQNCSGRRRAQSLNRSVAATYDFGYRPSGATTQFVALLKPLPTRGDEPPRHGDV